MRLVKVNVGDIRYGGELPGNPEPLRDGAAEPIIASAEQGESGLYYDLIDGYHRLDGMIAAGETVVTVLVPDRDDLDLSADFGAGDMPESQWIGLMQREAAGLEVANA